MRNSTTRYVILGLLTEGPLSGYDIKKIVDIRFRYFWSESYGQIYPQLSKIEKEIVRIEMVIKLYFGHLIPPTRLADFVQEFLASHQKDLETLKLFQSELQGLKTTHPNHPFILHTLDLGISVQSAYTTWAERMLKQIKTEDNK